MGQGPSGLPGKGKKDQKKKKKWEPPKPPTHIGRKKKKKGPQVAKKLPTVTPLNRCKLRKLKLERINDWLLLEHEFVQNQETLKPAEERNKEDQDKVEEISGSPVMVGSLEEMID